MNTHYGAIRNEDIPVLDSVLAIFKKHNLSVGFHGTSLWNPRYKDIDILVTSSAKDAQLFLTALDDIQKKHQANMTKIQGNNEIGLDYDLVIDNTIIHASYVILL